MKPTLVVLAAGMGSRYGGVKQIDSVGKNGETLLDYGVYDALKAGFKKVVFIIRKDIEKDFKERLFDRISRNMEAEFVFQSMDSLLSKKQIELSKNRVKPWGTIHAVLCAKEVINEPFCVINSDDYYGREAFEIMAKHLSTLDENSTEHALVGYVLRNTMSKSGSVSRAVCTIKDDYLVSMKENTKIEFVENKIISHIDNKAVEMSGDEWVSMNFFGFAPSALVSFEKYWNEFIEKNISSEKVECYLPEGASEIVKTNQGKLKFYTTNEKWFGMTYSEDRDNVKKELARKTEEGYYPPILWEK